VINKTEKGFGQMGAVKADTIKVVSLIWLTGEVLLAGTRSNELLLIEAGDLKMKFKADTVEFIDLTKIQDEDTQMATPSQASLQMEKTDGGEPEPIDVMCLTYFEKGFAFAINNVVHVFEQETQMKYRKKSLITVAVTLYAESLYKITNLAINAQQDTIIVTTKHPQIYIGMLYVPETLNVTELTFKTFGEALHINQIVDLDVCGWKTIVMTACKRCFFHENQVIY
jgi:cilia- and flagella-associated protein 57